MSSERVDLATSPVDLSELPTLDHQVVGNAAALRSNMGLGSAATHPSGDFDTAGAASAAQANAIAASAQALTPTAVKTGAYTLAAGDFVPVDATSGTVALLLPSAPADRTRAGAKLIVATNTCTITCGGSDVFNKAGGSTVLTLSAANQGVLLQYKASTGIWYVSTADTPLSTPLGAAKLGTDGTVGGSGGSALTGSVVTASSVTSGGTGSRIPVTSTPQLLGVYNGESNQSGSSLSGGLPSPDGYGLGFTYSEDGGLSWSRLPGGKILQTSPTTSNYDGGFIHGASMAVVGRRLFVVYDCAPLSGTAWNIGLSIWNSGVPVGAPDVRQQLMTPSGGASWRNSSLAFPTLYFDQGTEILHLFFSGQSGTVGGPTRASIGHATINTNTLAITEDAGNPILVPDGSSIYGLAIGCVFQDFDGTYYMFCGAFTNAGSTVSTAVKYTATSLSGPWTGPSTVYTPRASAYQALAADAAAAATQVQVASSAGFTAGDPVFIQDSRHLTLPAPSGLSATPVGSGGTFAANTYFWNVVAINAAGFTTGAGEQSATIVLNGSATIAWSAPAGANGEKPLAYAIYRATAGGGTSSGSALVAVVSAASLSYTDTGTATTGATALPSWIVATAAGANTPAAVPASNNAYLNGSISPGNTADNWETNYVASLPDSTHVALRNPLSSSYLAASAAEIVAADQVKVQPYSCFKTADGYVLPATTWNAGTLTYHEDMIALKTASLASGSYSLDRARGFLLPVTGSQGKTRNAWDKISHENMFCIPFPRIARALDAARKSSTQLQTMFRSTASGLTGSTAWAGIYFTGPPGTGLDCWMPARSGDVIRVSPQFLWNNNGAVNAFCDLAVLRYDNGQVIFVRWASGGTGQAADGGIPAWFAPSGVYSPMSATYYLTVQDTDLTVGNIAIRPVYRLSGSATRTLGGISANPSITVTYENLGGGGLLE